MTAATPAQCPADPLRVLRSVCAGLEKPPGAPQASLPLHHRQLSSRLLTHATSRSAAKAEQWEQLEFLCPEALPLAADILDHKTIIRCVAKESQREFYTVSSGNSKHQHCVIPGWCSCNSYAFEVLGSRKLVCKHELAVMVAAALSLGHTNVMDDERWGHEFALATRLSLVTNGA